MAPTIPLDGTRPLKALLDEHARQLIASALAIGGTWTRAASLLQTPRASLYTRARRLGLELAPFERRRPRRLFERRQAG